jgi:hypothetical protein
MHEDPGIRQSMSRRLAELPLQRLSNKHSR